MVSADSSGFALVPAHSEQDFCAIAELAREIWPECFTPIIGDAQVEYMLTHLQSKEAITRAVRQDGYQYCSVYFGGQTAGYTAYQLRGDGLFLSKLYFKSELRKKGLARKTVQKLVDIARQQGLLKIYLSVNIHNARAIAAYEALGFCRTERVTADIGGGFVMDDWRMEKTIESVKLASASSGQNRI